MLNGIKKLRALFCDDYWKAKQKYIDYYEKLPIDEKAILLESEHGKKIDGNIFYLVRYLASSEKYKDYKIYLSSVGRNVTKFEAFLDSHGINNVSIVILASDAYMRILASAKYLINDTSFAPYFTKKPGQIYLNTWHGTPLKTLGKNDAGEYHSIGNVQRNFLASDYLLYPNVYTRDIMLLDYMVENLSEGSVILAGYPRNEIFFDDKSRLSVREEMELDGKRVYVYMPTYRGKVAKGKTSRSAAYLIYYLCEIEKRLGDDEVLYVNLHPLANDGVDFSEFTKIKQFPKQYEVYEFLNAADVLITDYSSVFFDFAVTGRKTVLFTYDEEEYLASRGMYIDIRELPFPHAYDIDSLLDEIRSEKSYDDSKFLEEFCKWEAPDASARLADALILNDKTGVTFEPIPSNGKENVVIYAGNLAPNGLTSSLMSMLNTIDTEEKNYFVAFKSEWISKDKQMIKLLPDGVGYIAMSGEINVSIRDRIVRKLFKKKLMSASRYMKCVKKHTALALKNQRFGGAKIDSLIQFTGYDAEIILEFSAFDGNKSIFVHSDMLEEIRTRGNQRRDVLKYAYRAYDKVAVVTESLIEPTLKISGKRENIVVVKNTINHKAVYEKGQMPLDEPDYEECSVDFDTLKEILSSSAIKLINIGRFGPEKGHIRLIDAFSKFVKEKPDSYLIIIGGGSFDNYYEKTKQHIAELGLEDRVVLIFKTPNPYRILNRCDGFILSSFYEGFGLVLAEADILGKPAISTDIGGPRAFMRAAGGTMVENSESGILEGMRMLADGKIKPMNVDYVKYNAEVVEEFSALFK